MHFPFEVVEAQAEKLGVPLMIRGADWSGYEEQFLDAMKECEEAGITTPFSEISTLKITWNGFRKHVQKSIWKQCIHFGWSLVARS